jgi:hypothetical protein
MAVINIADRLFAAQRASLNSGADDIARFYLNPARPGVSGLDVADQIVSASATLTLNGPSTLTVQVYDPDWLVEQSGVLDPNTDGLLDAVDVNLDTLVYRLAEATRREPDVLELTFEDRVAMLLKIKKGAKAFSRGNFTRAQAIEAMVREIKTYDFAFYSPEKGHKQPRDAPSYPEASPAEGASGFDVGATFKIKGVAVDGEQKRQIATAMTVADQLDVTPKVRKAMLVAGIGESDFRAVPNSEGSNYWGVFQGNKNVWAVGDTEGMARSFFKGGKGYNGGGAIALNHASPGISVGAIATRVEGSGKPPSFYDEFAKEADAIMAAWNSGKGAGGADSSVLRAKQYQYKREKDESTYAAAVRLAEEVQWRFYVAGGVAAFASDEYLITRKAALTLDSIDDDMLLERPTYDFDHGKGTTEVGLRVLANRWEVRPAMVVYLGGNSFGPAKGRWIVETVEQNLLDSTDCTVTLIKSTPALKEKAAEILTSQGTTSASATGATGGAARAIAWAASKLGHYKENLGINAGTELNELEATFGWQQGGQPWCAMFATTAVSKGVGDSGRSPLVKEIRRWAMEGSHGYERGLRATPQPGDLMLFGDTHVVLVEKVTGTSVVTLDGNPSVGRVVRGGRLNSTGDFVRPAYID